jgi:predicted lipid-binding transport protein (Tim44 family)
MTAILVLMALGSIVGFLLSIYLFFYRLQLKVFWRWFGGIAGGIILGGLMGLLILSILWPPVGDLLFAGGLSLIAISIMLILDFPKSTTTNEQAAIDLQSCIE